MVAKYSVGVLFHFSAFFILFCLFGVFFCFFWLFQLVIAQSRVAKNKAKKWFDPNDARGAGCRGPSNEISSSDTRFMQKAAAGLCCARCYLSTLGVSVSFFSDA